MPKFKINNSGAKRLNDYEMHGATIKIKIKLATQVTVAFGLGAGHLQFGTPFM